MATTVTIDAPSADSATVSRAFDWFQVVEHTCTRFDPDSELSRLTGNVGHAIAVSPILFESIRFALHIADLSGGAFDPTVGARMHQRGFDREHRSGARVPAMVDSHSDATYQDVAVDDEHRTVTLRRPLVLDLGAVAKGLAIDLAARELQSSGSFVIDAGGDLYLGGTRADDEPWTVGIRHPRRPGECIAAVGVSNQAVCTSGDYERETPGGAGEHDPGEHHILDPHTGRSPGRVASVTVVAPSAMLADALATAAFVLGPERGLALLEELEVDGLVVTKGLEHVQTAGWPTLEAAAAAHRHA